MVYMLRYLLKKIRRNKYSNAAYVSIYLSTTSIPSMYGKRETEGDIYIFIYV